MAKTYEAMMIQESPTRSEWQFLNLQNRKQVGDLEKRILFFQKKNNHKVFNFACSRGEEGVSTIVANLVDYMTKKSADKTTLIIDTNFQHPELHKIFNVSIDKGLTDLLRSSINFREAIKKINTLNIDILTCGNDFPEFAGNIEQEKLKRIIRELCDSYDYIFMDSAPILTSSDALASATASDITFLVIKSLTVQREVAEKAKNLLLNNECLIGGAILNKVIQVIPDWLYKII